MGQPPRKCAVMGMLKMSPTVPPGVPSILSASRRVASLPLGIHDGLGSPCPCLLETYRNGPRRLTKVCSELSRFCMTSTITVRWLQRR